MITMDIPNTSAGTFPEFSEPSNDQVSVVLGAYATQIVNVPVGTSYAIFQADAAFYCAYDNVVDIPDDNPGQASTNTEYNPGQRFIKNVSEIQVKAKSLTHLHISFYS